MFTSRCSSLTFGERHLRLHVSRPSRGALMRRHEGGAGPAPAGVVRSCTPGRTPEQPRRLLWAARVRAPWNAKAGKAGGALDRRVSSFGVCSGAPRPLTLGEWKERRANPKPDQTWGRRSSRCLIVESVFSVRPRGGGGPGVKIAVGKSGSPLARGRTGKEVHNRGCSRLPRRPNLSAETRTDCRWRQHDRD